MGHFERFSLRIAARHCDDGARQKPQSARGVAFRRAFHAVLEHQVFAEADSQKGDACAHSVANSLHLPEFAHRRRRIREGPDTWQDDGVRFGYLGRVRRDESLDARSDEAALDGFQVALLVIDYRYHSHLLQGAFGRRQRIAHARVGLDRLAHRARHRLEHALDHVMGVLPGKLADM